MISVTIYTTGPQCPQCMLTKKALAARGIDYTDVDLRDSANGAARDYVTEDLGYSQAPVVVVDDEPQNHWSGFRDDLIRGLASRSGLSR
mgnify:FL=1